MSESKKIAFYLSILQSVGGRLDFFFYFSFLELMN